MLRCSFNFDFDGKEKVYSKRIELIHISSDPTVIMTVKEEKKERGKRRKIQSNIGIELAKDECMQLRDFLNGVINNMNEWVKGTITQGEGSE
jgi:hypothetical protein